MGVTAAVALIGCCAPAVMGFPAHPGNQLSAWQRLRFLRVNK